MLPEDQKRLERETNIAKAARGPDYSMLENSISRNKAAARDAEYLQAEANRIFNMHAARKKALEESGPTPRHLIADTPQISR